MMLVRMINGDDGAVWWFGLVVVCGTWM